MTVKWINSHSPKYEIITFNQTIVEEESSYYWKRAQSKNNFKVAEQLIKLAGL